MKILGIVNSQGDFNGTRYHNLVLHCSYEETSTTKDFSGLLVDTVKLRFSDLNSIFDLGFADPKDVEKLHAEDFSHLIGEEIDVAYNKFGGVQSVKILGASDKKS